LLQVDPILVVVIGKGMSRILPWIIATVCFVAFAASFSEVHRLKARVGKLSSRPLIIRAAIEAADDPIVILGDSITQRASLPREICGHPVVNAGVWAMNIRQATTLLPLLFADRTAFMIVLSLGANDAGSKSAGQDFSKLIRTAEQFAPRVIAISDAFDPDVDLQISRSSELPYIQPHLPEGSRLPDGVHFNEVGYANWIPALKSAVESRCGHA
jgi:hypothetical protein